MAFGSLFHHFWPCVDYTLGNLESKSICSIPKFFWWYHSVEVLYEMVVPGSTLATISIIYTTYHPLRHHCCPPLTTTASSSAANLSTCAHHGQRRRPCWQTMRTTVAASLPSGRSSTPRTRTPQGQRRRRGQP